MSAPIAALGPLSLPRQPLEGRQVRLTPVTAADIDERLPAWLNDPLVVRHSNQRFHVHTRDTCLAYLRSFEGSPNRYFLIRRRDTQEAIGTMTAYLSVHHGTVDLGLLVGQREVWGQGFGQDSWDTLQAAVLTTAGVRKLTGGTLAANTGMRRIFERAGMQLEAVRHGQELLDGQPQDIVYYARFADRQA